MRKKYVLFVIIIMLEILFIGYLLKLLNQGKFLLVIESQNKSQFLIINETGIKYFYEPVPNIVDVKSSEFFGRTRINTVNNDSLYERYNYSIENRRILIG